MSGKRAIGAVVAGLALAGAMVLPLAPAPPAVAGSRPAAAGDYWITAGDQAGNRLIAFDPAAPDWNASSAVRWTWRPTAAEGFSSGEINGFSNVSDLRLRTTPGGAQRFVVTASGGLAAIMSYPEGTRQWAKVIPGNLHAAELLPNGDLAVAASTGGWVRVYAAATGGSTYTQYSMTGAHGVLWDPIRQRLWALGTTSLTALIVGGSPSSPTLRVDTTDALPTRNGHDLSADPVDPDKLLLSTGSAVYRYDTTSRAFTPLAVGNRVGVKSVTGQPSGQLVETRPDNGRCTQNTWCTDTVDLFSPAGTRVRTGAAFYKARVWNPHYDAVGDRPHGPVTDRTRSGDGTWSASRQVDDNAAVTDISAAALPDGTLHVQTLVPGSGVYDRVRDADGTWSVSTRIDANGSVAAVSAAALPDGTLHVQTLVPGSGVYDRTRSADGTWTTTTKIDDNGAITALSTAGLPDGTLHVQTLVPGGGVWDRARGTGGTWATSSQVDDNGAITALSAAALPDGTLHLQTVVPGHGGYDRARSAAGTWAGTTHPATDGAVFAAYAAALPDGTLHLGTAAYPD